MAKLNYWNGTAWVTIAEDNTDYNNFRANGGTVGGTLSFGNGSITNVGTTSFLLDGTPGKFVGFRVRKASGADEVDAFLDPSVLSFRNSSNLAGKMSLGTQEVPWGSLWLGTPSLNTNGYTKLPNGLIMQWGSVIAPGTTSGTITYPIAFPNSVFQAVGTINRGDATLHVLNINATRGNKTTFSWYTDKTISTGVAVMWIAIGY